MVRAEFEDDNNKLIAQYFEAVSPSNSNERTRESEDENRREKLRLSMKIVDWRIRVRGNSR